MAQIIHNISTPNDGLGDQLRTGFDHQNQMNTELYNTKVDKVTGKGLSTNDYTNAEKSKLEGIEAGAQVNVQADFSQTDENADDFIKNKPEQLFSTVGYFHFNNTATAQSITADTETELINNSAGAFTVLTQAPFGVLPIWNATNNEFDFSSLSIGDQLGVRVDLAVTTSTNNQVFSTFIRFAEGTPNEYDLLIDKRQIKTSGLNQIISQVQFSLDNEDWLNEPAKIYFVSDSSATVFVNGWYTPIIRKAINIVEVVGSSTQLPLGLLSVGLIETDGNEITYLTGFSWRVILDVLQNIETTFTIPLTTEGFSRIDLFVGNTAGQIVHIEGIESENPIAPVQPVNTVFINLVLVSDTGVNPNIPELVSFLEKQTFAYTPLSSITFEEAPLSMNFITTDGDGVDSFSGFATGSVFTGKRMIIRNDKTVDFPCNSFIPEFPLTFDFTFDKNYIIKAGESMEFDFAQGKFKRVGLDAIPRLGTVEGEPVEGDLEFAGEGANYGIKWQNADATFMNYLYLFSDRLRFVFEDFSFDTPTDEIGFQTIATRNFVNGLVVDANFTAQANGRYRTTSTLTITDPANGNYFVMVESGTCTIGGVGYVAGDWIWRVGSTSYKINGAGGGGTTVHNELTGRDAENAHPISAITGLQAELDAKLDKEDLLVTPVAGVINSTPEMSDRVLKLNVGSTATTFNINHELRNVGLKKDGSGVVTFVSGAGRTLNTLTSTDKLTSDGAVGLLFADGTVDNLYTNDGTEEALLKSGYKSGALASTDFSLIGGVMEAQVSFVNEYPDANYNEWINFRRVSGSLFSLPYVTEDLTTAGFKVKLNTDTTPTGLVVIWQTFRNE